MHWLGVGTWRGAMSDDPEVLAALKALREAVKAMRDARRLRGECATCGEPSPKTYRCQACLERARDTSKALRRSA